MKRLVSLVLPFYNEAENVPLFFERLCRVLDTLPDHRFELVCINDGSRDATLENLLLAQRRYGTARISVLLVDFTRNFGKEAAMTAGLDQASGEAIVFMDTDLQHPPELIADFLAAWCAGARVVLARRRSRETEGTLYRNAAEWFYRVHNAISDVRIPPNIGDFRLIDCVVADQLRCLPESRRFMKGLFAWVGYEPVLVEYDVAPRTHGKTSFNKWKSWNFALEGITSFSTAPLRLWSYLGLTFTLAGFVYAAWIVLRTLVVGVDVPGYASLLVAVVFMGGLQLIGIGVMGEYIGRTYLEVKRRPTYLVRQVISQPGPGEDDTTSVQ